MDAIDKVPVLMGASSSQFVSFKFYGSACAAPSFDFNKPLYEVEIQNIAVSELTTRFLCRETQKITAKRACALNVSHRQREAILAFFEECGKLLAAITICHDTAFGLSVRGLLGRNPHLDFPGRLRIITGLGRSDPLR